MNNSKLTELKEWCLKWNEGYPFKQDQDEISWIARDYRKEIEELEERIFLQIDHNFSLINDYEKTVAYQEYVQDFKIKFKSWFNEKVLTQEEFYNLNSIKHKETMDNIVYSTFSESSPQFILFVSAKEIYNEFKNAIDQIISRLDSYSPENSSIMNDLSKLESYYFPKVKAAHLHVFLKGLQRQLGPSPNISNISIARYLSMIFLNKDNKNFGHKSITGKGPQYTNPTKEELLEVAEFLISLGSIIKIEAENNNQPYFRKSS